MPVLLCRMAIGDRMPVLLCRMAIGDRMPVARTIPHYAALITGLKILNNTSP